MRILFIAFIVLPILELYVLLKVGSFIGAIPTIGIILITAVVGYRLFRAQGMEKLQKMRSTMNGSIQNPNLMMDMTEGVAILLAGILLLTPGFVTDVFGFACLIPPIRKNMIKYLVSRSVIRTQGSFQSQFHTQSQNQGTHNPNSGRNIIEGEYEEKK